MALLEGEKANFGTLKRAVLRGHLALVEGKVKATGERVAILCAVSWSDETQEHSVTPFGHLCPGDNAYEYYDDPTEARP